MDYGKSTPMVIEFTNKESRKKNCDDYFVF